MRKLTKLQINSLGQYFPLEEELEDGRYFKELKSQTIYNVPVEDGFLSNVRMVYGYTPITVLRDDYIVVSSHLLIDWTCDDRWSNPEDHMTIAIYKLEDFETIENIIDDVRNEIDAQMKADVK